MYKLIKHCVPVHLYVLGTLTQAIRNFAKSLEGWITTALNIYPKKFVASKVGNILIFCNICIQLLECTNVLLHGCVQHHIMNLCLYVITSKGFGCCSLLPNLAALHFAKPSGTSSTSSASELQSSFSNVK